MSPNGEGKGRPFSGDKRKETTVNIRMERTEVEELDKMAHSLQTTRSGVIREGLRLVREMLVKNK